MNKHELTKATLAQLRTDEKVPARRRELLALCRPFNDATGTVEQQACQSACPAPGGRADTDGHALDVFYRGWRGESPPKLVQKIDACDGCAHWLAFKSKIRRGV